jgi:hypothetical protein
VSLRIRRLLHVEHTDGVFDMQSGQWLNVERSEWVR